MKLNKAFALGLLLLSTQAMAQGLLSHFALTKGHVGECPVGLDVMRRDDIVVVKMENAMEMGGIGPFSNNLFFNNFNRGWVTSETSLSGTFQQKTELLLGSTSAKLTMAERLVKNNETLRHTQIALQANEAGEAVLTYKIITLKSGMTSAAYANINCRYQATK